MAEILGKSAEKLREALNDVPSDLDLVEKTSGIKFGPLIFSNAFTVR
jgi:hypothetical protein